MMIFFGLLAHCADFKERHRFAIGKNDAVLYNSAKRLTRGL